MNTYAIIFKRTIDEVESVLRIEVEANTRERAVQKAVDLYAGWKPVAISLVK